MFDLGVQEVKLKTRELFTECLVSLGAWRRDLFTMSREDIEKFIRRVIPPCLPESYRYS
mgnify:CR=1 FL=1